MAFGKAKGRRACAALERTKMISAHSFQFALDGGCGSARVKPRKNPKRSSNMQYCAGI
jgi:hypothetical protein